MSGLSGLARSRLGVTGHGARPGGVQEAPCGAAKLTRPLAHFPVWRGYLPMVSAADEQFLFLPPDFHRRLRLQHSQDGLPLTCPWRATISLARQAAPGRETGRRGGRI